MLNPRVDSVFKKFFGSEENKAILIPFINAIVDEEDRVTDVELINPYDKNDLHSDKLRLLDIKATNTEGRNYHIEIQIADEMSDKRELFYWSKLYSSQVDPNKVFPELTKTICINLLNSNAFDNESGYHHLFRIANRKSRKTYLNHFEVHYIELQKFDTDVRQTQTALDRWVSFLTRANQYDQETLPQELTADPVIAKAFDILNTLSLDEEESEVYEKRLERLKEKDAALKTS